ncbi:sugar ABC transporter permease [Halobaculum sp. MBLA0147]|uniref:sugar ABC transporter permease n=1 Tax=Halobaculum sp. MBLA0147 TaxID=3079934 RepID=UPI0035232038
MSVLAAAATRLTSPVRSATGAVRDVANGDRDLRDVLVTALYTGGAMGLTGLLLFPVYWAFVVSISPPNSTVLSPGAIKLWPEQPTLLAYKWVFGSFTKPHELPIELPIGTLTFQIPGLPVPVNCGALPSGCSNFAGFFYNSVVVATFTTVLALLVVIPAAYALSRRSFKGRSKILYGYVLFTQVGGGLGIATLLALYILFQQAGLYNSKVALAVYYAATAVPFNTWLLKTYMDGIPVSYEEAAVVDGAGPLRVFWEVVIPLSKAGLATVLIFTFLTGWMEFVVANLLLEPSNATLPVGLFGVAGQRFTPWPRFTAFALSFAAPIMGVYFFAQGYLEGGLSFGGMEG